MITWSALPAIEQQDALARPAMADNQRIRDAVSDVISLVQDEGDSALFALTDRFDDVELQTLALSQERWQALAAQTPEATQQAITQAFNNIKAFHEAQRPANIRLETQPGVVCEQRYDPLSAVGLYVPSGSAPLPSTVLMLGIPALVAGCPRRVLCTPPDKNGDIAPAICFAASLCGITEIYRLGGAQAIAAMGIGSQSVVKVDKIFGPGNAYVTEAKQQISQIPGGAAIDMPAGPSEVLVLADHTANPVFVAADLLSQAEHGADSQAILVSTSETLVQQTEQEVARQLDSLTRQDITRQAMANARYIWVRDIDEAIEVSNRYAPEHLIVQTEQPRALVPKLQNAGSIFLGQWSPESAGDYASGTNHVLPTYGYARNYSSLGLVDFMRRYTLQELSADGIRGLGPTLMTLADAEGLDAHKQAVAVRLEALNND
ncbi:histidinol dehydrogenase [Aestuariibacter halophilus]|uniref:Histidinol dehydrogenase n=1 Tax=Fluctibacter halophilus TaxID=226011 RepID=A0ABS8G6Z2_9ALTE|nr:histidinol dehydrogenase [Aestuariibacter halophilus]MCC2616288.1 histidinol dehydrogenase [Aestuariibacter halophilus]